MSAAPTTASSEIGKQTVAKLVDFLGFVISSSSSNHKDPQFFTDIFKCPTKAKWVASLFVEFQRPAQAQVSKITILLLAIRYPERLQYTTGSWGFFSISRML